MLIKLCPNCGYQNQVGCPDCGDGICCEQCSMPLDSEDAERNQIKPIPQYTSLKD